MALRRTCLSSLILLVILVPATVGHCGEVLDRVMKRGAVRLGVPYNRIPQGFLEGDGKWVGFEVDVAKEMAPELVKVNDKTWGSMLSSGRIDAAMCRIRHTRSLETQFDFSVPYFFDAPYILVLKGRFKNPAELAGHKIAAVQGTLPEKEAMRLLREEGDKMAEKNVVSYPDRPSCFMALGREKVSGWIDSGMSLIEYASRKPGRFELIKVTDRVEPVAIAVPQNDSAWRDLVNFTIQDMAADGSLKKIYEKWFGPKTPYAFPMRRAIEIWPQ
ncbi:MAG: transporter substrate-binding domain-containing protein [Deltaproteobacteria bacterium]